MSEDKCKVYDQHYIDNQGYCFGCGMPMYSDSWLWDNGLYREEDRDKCHAVFEKQLQEWREREQADEGQ